jgi:hypothetical protein
VTVRRRLTAEDYETVGAFVRAANLIHAIELVAEQSVGLALNDAKDYLNQRANAILDAAEGSDLSPEHGPRGDIHPDDVNLDGTLKR